MQLLSQPSVEPDFPIVCPKDKLTLIPTLVRTVHIQGSPRGSIHEQTWEYPCPLCGYCYEHYVDIYNEMESKVKRIEWARKAVQRAQDELQNAIRDMLEA